MRSEEPNGGWSPHVRLHHIDELLRGACLRRRRSAVGMNHVLANVPFDDFRHQAVYRAPGRRDEHHDIGAVLLALETAFYRLDFADRRSHA